MKRLANRSWDGSPERSAAWGLSLDGSSASGAGHGNDGSGSHGGDDDASMAGNVFGRVPSDYSWNGFHNAAGKAMEYLSRAGKGEASVGVPVYFFFRFDSTDLTDKAQMINLDAIAQVAKEWQLTVRVTGAADFATGSVDGNVSLSRARADCISRMLQERGVPGERIRTVAEGGIGKFSPPAVNRQCKVELIVN